MGLRNKRPEKIYYFSSTHWDREWYKTVDEFRFRLAPVMEKIMDVLENRGDFRLFTLDGQTRILDDYLTVGKENEPRLRRLVESGRLRVGPWYTMPDEFLLSSESLVRNLLKGHAVAAQYGAEPMKNGYVCDTFGHVANLPQLLNGFGIRSALISRGTNDCETPCFFRWRSPSGDEVLTFKAPETCGYGSFYYEVLSPFCPEAPNAEEELFARAVAYVERELTRTELPYVLLMDGMDHETIHEYVPSLLKKLEARFGCPVVQIPLDEAFGQIAAAAEAAGEIKRAKSAEERVVGGIAELPHIDAGTETLPVVVGELARLCKDNVMHNKLITHTLSSRYDLKRANDECQTLLEKYAMPICAIRAASGRRTRREFIDYAYDLLLENHAHDSICGCSIDAVHREMLARFEKVRRTALAYSNTFYADEYARVERKDGKTVVKVYNPLPYEYEGAVTLEIRFDKTFPVRELPYVKFEQRNGFRIFDGKGREVKYDLVCAAREKKETNFFGPHYSFYDTHTVMIYAKLPPMSFTSFEIRPFDRPYRLQERFSVFPVACDNGKIAFSINADGTLRVEDKDTGAVYDKLHSFEDCGEIGDGWFHIRPVSDERVSSFGCPVKISKVFDGYAACRFRVEYEFRIPARAEKQFGFAKRVGETALKIDSEFTVERNSKLIKVHTVVRNAALDHRLSLRLPVKAKDSFYVNQCNLILRRETGLSPETYDWKETDIPERAFENMVFTRENGAGLLFLSKGGLHETFDLGGDQPALNVTLFRSFRTTVGTNGEPDGELQGDLAFDYAIAPLSGETDAELVRLKDVYACDFPSFTVRTDDLSDLPSAMEFRSANCAYVTSMQEGDGIVVRAANYSVERSAGELRFPRPPKSACLCDYLGNATGEAVIRGNAVHFVAAPYQSVNVKVVF